MSGIAGVFSAEFYVNCFRRLNTNGVMCQWLHVYAMPREAVDTVIATFTRVFPYTRIWAGSVGDIMLVGGSAPTEVDLEKITERFKIPAVRDGLRRVAIDRPLVFLAHELTTEDMTEFIPPNGQPLHGDYYPVLDTLAQKGAFLMANSLHVYDFDAREEMRPKSLLAQYLSKHQPGPSDYLSLDIRNRPGAAQAGPGGRSWRAGGGRTRQSSTAAAVVQLRGRAPPQRNDIGRLGRCCRSEEDPRNGRWCGDFVCGDNLYRDSSSVFYKPESEVLIKMMEMMIDSLPELAPVMKCSGRSPLGGGRHEIRGGRFRSLHEESGRGQSRSVSSGHEVESCCVIWSIITWIDGLEKVMMCMRSTMVASWARKLRASMPSNGRGAGRHGTAGQSGAATQGAGAPAPAPAQVSGLGIGC